MTSKIERKICESCGWVRECMKFFKGWHCRACMIDSIGYEKSIKIIEEYRKDTA